MPNWFRRREWKNSKAHLLLLSKFQHPRTTEEFTELSDLLIVRWTAVLGEHPRKALDCFLKEQMIQRGGTRECLDAAYRVTDLKPLLKERGLKVSGKKAELIDRLIDADPAGMDNLASGLNVYVCTIQGRTIAEQFVEEEKAVRSSTETASMVALKKGHFEEACSIVRAYEVEQVFPRGLNIDWSRIEPKKWSKEIKLVFEGSPKILGYVAPDQLRTFQIGAGMMMLWGTNTAREWLPADLQPGLRFSNDVAARMILFWAYNRRNLASYRANSESRAVRVIPAHDACRECQRLRDMVFTIDGAPELPYEHCTSDMGCRCGYVADTDLSPRSQ